MKKECKCKSNDNVVPICLKKEMLGTVSTDNLMEQHFMKGLEITRTDNSWRLSHRDSEAYLEYASFRELVIDMALNNIREKM